MIAAPGGLSHAFVRAGLALLWFACQNSLATDYFVSANGNDAATGMAPDMVAGRPSEGPFATLAPLVKLPLQNGDRILLACGQRFQGPLRLSLASQQPGVLTITSYGDCAADKRPVLDGRMPVAGLAGSGPKTVAQERPVVQVFSGDRVLERGRFPKGDYLIFPEGTTASVDRVPAHSQLFDKDLRNALIHARTQEWLLEEKRIAGRDGALDTALRYPLRPKAGVYFSGKAWMLGEADGWVYDMGSKSLHVQNKAGGVMSVVQAGHLLQIEGRGALSINGLAFNAAGGDAINVKLDGVVNISDVLITRASGNGIAISGSSFAQITNSTIAETGRDGIFFAEAARVVVRQNIVKNAGIYLGPGQSLAAINAHRTQGATIEENEVIRSAYIGIRFAGDARIRGNVIESSCLYFSDCGAIYTWRRGQDDVRAPVEISGNVINGVGGDTSVKFGVNDWFAGIYLDEWTRGATVKGNVIADAGQGVYLHNARGNVVDGNYILGARHGGVIAKDDAKALTNELIAIQEVPNRVEENYELKGRDSWSLRPLGATGGTVNVPLQIVFGINKPGEKLALTILPSACRHIPLGGTKAKLSIFSAQVFSCK